jgi:hypothetical protein
VRGTIAIGLAVAAALAGATVGRGGRGDAASDASVPWSGTITVSYSAKGHTDSDTAEQSISESFTLDSGAVKGHADGSYRYTRTGPCGTSTWTASGGADAAGPAGVGSGGAGTYTVSVGVGAGGLTETYSGFNAVDRCKPESSTHSTSLSAGVATVTASGDDATATTLSGSATLGPGTGCQGAQPGPQFTSFPNDSCTLTVTWDLFRCDESLIRKADREWLRAEILMGQGDETFERAHGEYQQWLADEVKESTEIAVVKGSLLKVLERLSHKAASFVEEVVAPVFTFYWIASDVEPHILDHDRQIDEMRRLYAQADALSRQATKDFTAALAQGGACRKQAEQRRKREDLHEQARALIESWENTGRGLYWSPTRGEWEDERAALREAEGILEGTVRAPQARAGASARPPSKHRIGIHASQIRAALPFAGRALRLHADALARERAAQARTASFVKHLSALLLRRR